MLVVNDAQEPRVMCSLGTLFLREPDLRDGDPPKVGSVAAGLCPDKVSDPSGGRAVGREGGLAMFSG